MANPGRSTRRKWKFTGHSLILLPGEVLKCNAGCDASMVGEYEVYLYHDPETEETLVYCVNCHDKEQSHANKPA